MRSWTGVAVRRLVIEVAGWTVLLVGIAAIPLPGPGLLMVFLGMAILSQRYTWAERRVLWVKQQALKAASDGVQTVPADHRLAARLRLAHRARRRLGARADGRARLVAARRGALARGRLGNGRRPDPLRASSRSG